MSKFGLTSHQNPQEWQGETPLPAQIAAFYRSVGPENILIDSLGDPILLFALDALWGAQAGYRWNRRSGARLVDWDDEWFVIARQGNDPWIFDSRTGEVLLAPGEEGWEERLSEPEPYFEDLAVAVDVIAAVGEAYALYEEDPFTDDLKVRAELAESVVLALSTALPPKHPVLGSASERARNLASKWGYSLT